MQRKWLGVAAQSDAHSSGIQAVADSILSVQQHSFVEICHEIISMAILTLSLTKGCALSTG